MKRRALRIERILIRVSANTLVSYVRSKQFAGDDHSRRQQKWNLKTPSSLLLKPLKAYQGYLRGRKQMQNAMIEKERE